MLHFEFPFQEFQDKYHSQPNDSLEVKMKIFPPKRFPLCFEVDQTLIIEKLTQQVNILQNDLSEKEQLVGKKEIEYQTLTELYNNCEEKRRKLTEQLDVTTKLFFACY